MTTCQVETSGVRELSGPLNLCLVGKASLTPLLSRAPQTPKSRRERLRNGGLPARGLRDLSWSKSKLDAQESTLSSVWSLQVSEAEWTPGLVINHCSSCWLCPIHGWLSVSMSQHGRERGRSSNLLIAKLELHYPAVVVVVG